MDLSQTAIGTTGGRLRCVGASMLMCTAIILGGCGTASPLSPAPNSSAPPLTPTLPTAAVALWNLTTVLATVTGPDNCFTQQQVRLGIPRSLSWGLEVARTGNAVSFEYSDDLRETGTVDGVEFTAQSVSSRTSFPTCPGGTVLSGTFDASVTGRFSDDGRLLAAKEVWAYHFTSGDVTFLLDWSADQR